MSKPKSNAPAPVETADDRLDEALEETFPASDPIAVAPFIERPEPRPAPHAPAKEKKHG
ncbi:MAG TPA: hypothetical protein VG105_07210 [Paraburkholderia sp.]|jgi:hypothetical protein|nr:hypothetical protein [Paraburkholderia sp.]